MSATLKITLKANEKIYINGAVLRADRKVSIEVLNDVQFLLENHVLQAEDACTPLRQLYFAVQVMLIDPQSAAAARGLFRQSLPLLLACFSDQQMLAGLKHVDQLVAEGHIYDALKAIRALYVVEDKIMDKQTTTAERPVLALVVGG